MDKKTIEKICKINELLSGLSIDVNLVAIDKDNEEYQFNSILMDGDVIYLGDFCHIDEFHWSIYLENVGFCLYINKDVVDKYVFHGKLYLKRFTGETDETSV